MPFVLVVMPCRTCLNIPYRQSHSPPKQQRRVWVRQLQGNTRDKGIPDGTELPEEFEQLLGSHVVAVIDGVSLLRMDELDTRDGIPQVLYEQSSVKVN